MITRTLLLFLFVSSCFGADKPKVFVTGQSSFQVSGAGGEESVSGIGDPIVAEGIKLFQNNCAVVTVNMRRVKADYIVSVSDDGSGAGRKGRRTVVFIPSGELIFSNSARSLKNTVKDACQAIGKDWPARASSDKQAAGNSQIR
jgi:hypothetical protein